MTRSPINCMSTRGREHSPNKPSRRESRSAKMAWRARVWGWMRPITIVPGMPSIIVGNFSNQMMALYHNEGNGLFVDEAPRSEVGRKSLLTLGFACFFFDYDNDGWLDIFVANGHIENEIERIQKRVKYAQPAHLFHNQGGGKFVDATAVGRALTSACRALGALLPMRTCITMAISMC